jgi:uncharacterized RDD family membrane protein YckC
MAAPTASKPPPGYPPTAEPGPWDAPSASEAPAKRGYLGYEPGRARLRRRLVALVVDNIVCFPLLVPCVLMTDALGIRRVGVGFLYLAACLLYFFLLELHTGQTVGKRIAGLRVVRADGKPVDVMGIGARNGLRLIDGIPGIPLVGALAMTLTGERRRRIGDLAGRTIVVEADQHDFVRGAWSPLIVVYPLVWIGMAIGGGLLAFSSEDNYLAQVDNICRARVEAQNRAGMTVLRALVLSHQETELIEKLPYPPNLWRTQHEVVALKRRVDGVAEVILREAIASGHPERVWAARKSELIAVSEQVNARFEAMGLYYCAR